MMMMLPVPVLVQMPMLVLKRMWMWMLAKFIISRPISLHKQETKKVRQEFLPHSSSSI
ncbi:hypothetical protein EGK70_011500 [Alcaligenes aquatilis]|uniref:hypothetical protein n=1 Tax=Alcaligenes aquatilis TaxID=323284 RepID=UPI00141A0AB3|nr:hypothetical protein [Alcaligenes aquatilis]QXR34507.1 hypothetical protein EGK70_011500 [Alcaligenes aquatilis]